MRAGRHAKDVACSLSVQQWVYSGCCWRAKCVVGLAELAGVHGSLCLAAGVRHLYSREQHVTWPTGLDFAVLLGGQ